jgi:hypothetical protein
MMAVAVMAALQGAAAGLWRRGVSFGRRAREYEQMGIREHLRMKQAFPFLFDHRDTAYYRLGEFFFSLQDKYEYAASHPWLPVPADPPRPEWPEGYPPPANPL